MEILYPSTIANLAEARYRSESALSASLIKAFPQAASPYHFYAQNLHASRPPFYPSPAMTLGTTVHSRLELKTQGEFENTHAKMPKGMRKIGKPADEFRLANKGKKLVGYSEWDLSFEMWKGITRNKTALSIMEEGIAEESFFFKHEATGEKVKGRIDVRCPKMGIIADWKTCMNASPFSRDGFAKSIRMGRLDLQLMFYLNATNRFWGKVENKTYDAIFIAIEKTWPFQCSLIALRPEDARRAQDEVMGLLDEVAKRKANNDWGDGFGESVHMIDIGNINAG